MTAREAAVRAGEYLVCLEGVNYIVRWFGSSGYHVFHLKERPHCSGELHRRQLRSGDIYLHKVFMKFVLQYCSPPDVVEG